VYVANWPAARRQHWMTLLRARAIENLSYVIAVNRVGKDGNDIEYAGDSCVIDPWGNYLLKMDAQEKIGTVDLDLVSLREYRESFPAHLDADTFDFK
jgi:predicted amidohydrolase